MRALALLACAACGRLDFTTRPDARADAALTVCGTVDLSPPQVTFAGQTFRYTSFGNTHTSIASVTVVAYDAASNAELARTTSDASGNYALALAPGQPYFEYSSSTWFTSRLYLDRVLDADVTGPSQLQWQLGDAPLWNAAGMITIYDTVSLTRDPTKGTVNIALRTCAGASIEGVTVAVDPPPAAIAYTTMTGITMVASQLPYSHAVAFNVLPGQTRITASARGLTFPELTIDVQPGTSNALTILHPYD